MGRYRKIDPRIWCDSKFASLDIHGQRLFLYILTCPQMTAVGAFRGSALNMALELGYVKGFGEELPKAFGKAFADLKEKCLIKVDEKALMVFVPNFIRYNEPECPNVVVGWASVVEYLPECPLLVDVVAKAIEAGKTKFPKNINATKKLERLHVKLCHDFGNRLGNGLPNHLGKPLVKPLVKPSGEPFAQEQEQEQEYKGNTRARVSPPLDDLSDSDPQPADGTARAGKRSKAKAAERPEDVTLEAWDDWQAVRRKKGAPPATDLVIRKLRTQAQKAGRTLQEMVETCVTRNWVFAQSEWLQPKPYDKPLAPDPMDAFAVKNRQTPPDEPPPEDADADMAWLEEAQ